MIEEEFEQEQEEYIKLHVKLQGDLQTPFNTSGTVVNITLSNLCLDVPRGSRVDAPVSPNLLSFVLVTAATHPR